MHGIPLLRDLVILVAIAVPVVVLAYRLRIPSVVGFLVSGIAIVFGLLLLAGGGRRD